MKNRYTCGKLQNYEKLSVKAGDLNELLQFDDMLVAEEN